MKVLLERVRAHASHRPRQLALRDEQGELDYPGLLAEVECLRALVRGQRVGLLLDNGLAWVCLDLAVLAHGGIAVPLPTFFSDGQLSHVLNDAGVTRVITDQPERVAALLNAPPDTVIAVAGRGLGLFRRRCGDPPRLPADTAKITYTSGSTGAPKGVCLSGETLAGVTQALCEAVRGTANDRCLSVLPLSTLLENIAGVYAPLWAGGLSQVPSLSCCGVSGSSGVRVEALFRVMHWAAPTITVLVPQLLKAVVGGATGGLSVPASLRFVAVGGAPLAAPLAAQARRLGLPVFEGFGLSEAGSVVCLNLPDAERPGSVGRALPHVQVRIHASGEVMVRGAVFQGYLGGACGLASGELATGDLGYLDADGFLFLTGRKATSYSTAFGRNVAPEWLEALLAGHPDIAQAAVFGAGRPFNVAVVVPGRGASPEAVGQAVTAINGGLPDYAQIGAWVVADEPFSGANGLLNGAGCPMRAAIAAAYRTPIAQKYEEAHDVL
ncbi:MAG: AMP-binding protein [Betaproteobacteria bacterium]|nr:AMP-binding protein [Betaproteobacteria bacterium]